MMNLKISPFHPSLKSLVDAYTKLAEELDKEVPGIEWTLSVEAEIGRDRVVLMGNDLQATGRDRRTMMMERRFTRKDSEVILDNSLLEIHPSLQGKGISARINRVGIKYLESVGGKTIRLSVNLDAGGYAWLRRGFWPDKGWKDIISNLGNYDVPADMMLRVTKLTEAQAKLFVLTDEFKDYKKYLDGAYWEGKADISDPVVKDLVTRLGPLKVKAARKPRVKKAPASHPRDIVSRHQVYLERLKAGYAGDYRKAIKESDKAIKSILSGLEVESLRELSRKQLKELLRDLRDAQLPYLTQAMDGITENMVLLATAEAAFEAELIKVTTKRVMKKAASAYSAALSNPIAATGDMLEGYVEDMLSRNVNRVNKEILKSIGQGRTIDQTVRAVRGTKAKNYQDGVLGKNWEDARTVIRTATQHVSSMARQATWVANSDIIDSYQWVSTLDGVTSDACKSLDGRVWKIGKGPLPPIHPNCRSTTVPYFPPSMYDDGATRSAEFGPVDADVTYYDWLKDQPEAFQVDALGKTKAKLFRDGGLSSKEFGLLQLDRNFEPITLTEMIKLNPHAFERAGITL